MRKKYINDQRYCECQLVSLWNAAIYHECSFLIPKFDSKKYKQICDKAGGIHGGCINTDHERERLGFEFEKGYYTLNYVKNNLPVEFSVHCHRGYHSVLAVEVKDDKVRLANYNRGRLHTIEWEKLLKKANRNVKPRSIKYCRDLAFKK